MTQVTIDSNNIYDRAVEEFRDFYNDSLIRLQSASASLATLLELLLTDHPVGFSTPTVITRVKRLDECLAKFDKKYKAKVQATPSYSIRDSITDLIGLRVICLYDDEIKAVESVVGDEFEVLNISDKSGEMEKSDQVFGYRGVHLDIRLHQKRHTLPEYKRFSDLQFEVQIRSTIQDSWSKLDHHINYKKDLPLDRRRRIYRLAALFELADQEFRTIRAERTSSPADVSSQPAMRLDEAVIQIGTDIYGKYPFTATPVNDFSAEILKSNPGATANWLLEVAARHKKNVLAYKEHLRTALMARMNPFTFIRHVLFSEDPKAFASLLFPRQLESYRRWMEAKPGEPRSPGPQPE